MVAYGFKRRFVMPIFEGTKIHTVRADRKRHARAGELLQLYYGMRTRQCRLIMQATCASVVPIEITMGRRPQIIVAGEDRDADSFARSDGFADFDDMARFWRAEHATLTKFSGWKIAWEWATATKRMRSTAWLEAAA
jgi:hypothetical protein